MSLIIAIAFKDRIIIKSDGRETGPNGIVSNDSPKIISFGKTVIGFTGTTSDRAKVVTHLLSNYGNSLYTLDPQILYDSARAYCKSDNTILSLTMIVASTSGASLFLKQFTNLDNYKVVDSLNTTLPAVAIAGDICLPFSSYNPANVEKSMDDYILATSAIKKTVGGTIFTHVLIK